LRVETSVARARKERVNDLEIHDTALIAAAFCMYNRYAFTPTIPARTTLWAQ
jgi:hypothetical protein